MRTSLRVTPPVATAVALSSLLALTGTALADGNDIGIFNIGGKLTTVIATGEPPSQAFGSDPVRVFGADFEYDILDDAVQVDEPGLATLPQPAAGSVEGLAIGFTHTRAVRRWNIGTGLFEATATTITAGRTDLGLPNVTSPASSTPTPLSTIASFPDDIHYLWVLDGATQSAGNGVYLVEGFLSNPGGTLASSDSIFLVFNYGLDEAEHDRAIGYVETVLVPTPGVASLLGLTGLMALRRRR